MTDTPRQYWFPAKRYGWGWGLPATWQGWMVIIVWWLIVAGGGFWTASRSMPLFFVFVVVMALGLVGICYAKGEPPKWRWGKE
jgi:uncharacterized membrane protein